MNENGNDRYIRFHTISDVTMTKSTAATKDYLSCKLANVEDEEESITKRSRMQFREVPDFYVQNFKPDAEGHRPHSALEALVKDFLPEMVR